ncbi:hypothetical protein AGMMS49543_28640 [Betaproteobacteria bacterium]|nr:hypothetical protein AGMMS49543_28640 [Betaproteobacteria bacterium]
MEFLNAILSYPTVAYTTLLGVVLVYWIFAIVGLVDFEQGGPQFDSVGNMDGDIEIDAGGLEAGADSADIDAGGHHDAHVLDGEVHHISTLAGYLVALGLGGVPFSVVVSLLALFSWFISTLLALWCLPIVPSGVLRFVVASIILLGAFGASLPLSALCVRPMRRLFVVNNAISNTSLVGMTCKVVTGTVDEQFGRAEVPTRGAGYHIRVVADTPNTLARGSVALITDYNETTMTYRIRVTGDASL